MLYDYCNHFIVEEETLIGGVRSHCCGVVFENEFHLLGGQTDKNRQTNSHQVLLLKNNFMIILSVIIIKGTLRKN